MELRGRIDEVKEVSSDALRAWLTTAGTDIVLVHHILPNGNPHFHFYLKSRFNSVASAKYNFKKRFVVDKTDWSLKECAADRRDEYLQYLFNTKHGNKPTLITSFKDLSEEQKRASVISTEFPSVPVRVKRLSRFMKSLLN